MVHSSNTSACLDWEATSKDANKVHDDLIVDMHSRSRREDKINMRLHTLRQGIREGPYGARASVLILVDRKVGIHHRDRRRDRDIDVQPLVGRAGTRGQTAFLQP